MDKHTLIDRQACMLTRADIIEDSCNAVDSKKGDNKEFRGICYCENEHCQKIYPFSCGVDGPTDAEGQTLLPCGHRLERLLASAIFLRRDNHDAEDYHWLRDNHLIDDDAMDALEEHKTEEGR